MNSINLNVLIYYHVHIFYNRFTIFNKTSYLFNILKFKAVKKNKYLTNNIDHTT